MGSDERDEVVDIASQVVDGVPVDWPSASERVVESSRDVVEQLRVIAEIARVHHALPDASSAFSQPSPGGVPWGPLLVFEKLGSGAFGDVFRAWDTSLQREVALKRLRSAADAAVEEGQRLARVSHPNVMAVYGAQRVGTEVG